MIISSCKFKMKLIKTRFKFIFKIGWTLMRQTFQDQGFVFILKYGLKLNIQKIKGHDFKVINPKVF